MDSDSDLQAYINELSRKTHDLKYDDHKSTSSSDLEPSHSSYIEIAVKKTGLTTDAENIEKQSIQTNKVKELEAKYLKRAIKSSELNLSSSFSEYNLEFEEEKLNTDNINTFPDETTIDSNAKASDKKFFKNTRIQEPPDSIENIKNARQVENLKSHSFEEDIKEDSHHSSQNNNKRKLSDNSSLLNKSSIFYSKNDKPGRQKPTGRIIFRMRSNTLSESDTIKSDVTSSVAEEIPEAMQNEIKETAKTTQMPMEDKDKSNSYEENTFENSEDSSTIKSINSSSKSQSESVLSQKNSSKSATEATESEQALSEALDGDDNTSERVTSSKGHSSTSPTKETSESSNDIEKSDDSVSQEDSSQSTSVKSEEDRSSPKSSKSSSVNTQSNKSSLQHNHQKVKKDYHKSKNKIEDKKLESSPKPSKSRMKDNKKKQRENDVSKKRSKMKPDSSSYSSSVVTSIQTSSTSSSFYVKMKKNKYREKKRKVKQEKELTELIIKLLIKFEMESKKILMMGTSEVGTLTHLKEQLQREYDIRLFISCHSGAKLMTLGQHLTRFFKTNGAVDQIYIFGLTCSIWKKVSLTSEDQSIQVITWDPVANMSLVPVQMDAINKIATKFNPHVMVYLVIPTMKDIASFNEAFLNRQGRSDLIPSLEQHPHLKRAFLTLKAREMFGKTVELQEPRFTWYNKMVFPMKRVFDQYYNNKNQANPHHQFWMGKSDRLDAMDMCYDGLHYTESAFNEMFAILSLTNFNRRAQEPRLVTPIVNIPTTTTTTSVSVEEIEAVPGPSGIQGRIDYRPSQPRTVPSTKMRRTKGKTETRVFHSRTFVGSKGLGEQPSTSSEPTLPPDRMKKKGSLLTCPTTSKSKKSSPTKATPPTSTTTSSNKKPKVKRLQSRYNQRRKMLRRLSKQKGTSQTSTSNNPPPVPSSTSSTIPELTTFLTYHVSQIWKFVKDKGFSKEVTLQELDRVIKQVSEIDPLE